MTPANDNVDPTRHAAIVLRHVLKGRQDVGVRVSAGLRYAETHNPAAMDATLAIAGAEVVAVARAVLREGRDLTQAGSECGPYKTEIQGRAWAAAKLECAISMLQWHPQRVERDSYNARLIERCKYFKAQNAALISRVA